MLTNYVKLGKSSVCLCTSRMLELVWSTALWQLVRYNPTKQMFRYTGTHWLLRYTKCVATAGSDTTCQQVARDDTDSDGGDACCLCIQYLVSQWFVPLNQTSYKVMKTTFVNTSLTAKFTVYFSWNFKYEECSVKRSTWLDFGVRLKKRIILWKHWFLLHY